MAGLFKYFQGQSTSLVLPTSENTGLGEALTVGANASVERAFENSKTPTKGRRKRKYTQFTPELRAKIAKYAAQCGNTAAVRHFSIEMS